jgi:hypothetical protein
MGLVGKYPRYVPKYSKYVTRCRQLQRDADDGQRRRHDAMQMTDNNADNNAATQVTGNNADNNDTAAEANAATKTMR